MKIPTEIKDTQIFIFFPQFFPLFIYFSGEGRLSEEEKRGKKISNGGKWS